MRKTVASLLLLVLLAGCAGSGSEGGGNPSMIGAEQLREMDPEGLTMLQVVQRLRSNWLRPRGTTSFGGGPSIPQVIVDGVAVGPVDELARLNAREVERAEFMSAADATTRFGTGYPGGVVLIRTR